MNSSIANRSKPNLPAFTLIELLVVIAIIAILAAMLLPALNSAKNRAVQAIDLNNNKQMMAAMIMYTTDNRERMAYTGWNGAYDNWVCGTGMNAGGGGTFNAYNLALNLGVNSQLNAERRGQLWAFLTTPKIYLCPNDKPDNVLFWQRINYLTSYTWDAAISGGSACKPLGYSYKITSVKFRPECIVQWECDERTPYLFNDPCNFPDEGISLRHGKGATVGLMSGGTERILSRNWYSADMAGNTRGYGGPVSVNPSPIPNRLWYSESTPTGTFTYP